MSARSIQKTQHWRGSDPNKISEQKGALTVLTAFMFFVFGTLGISMLFVTQIYIKTTGYKRNTILLDQAAENGVKQGLHEMLRRFSFAAFPLVLSLEEYELLGQDIHDEGNHVLELILGPEKSFNISGGEEKLSWEAETLFSKEILREAGDYFHLSFDADIISRGNMLNYDQYASSELEASLDIFLGHVPLPVFPFLVTGEWDEEKKKDFIEKNEIRFLPAGMNIFPESVHFSDKKILPKDTNSFLEKALKVKFFDPSELTIRQIREALGLEISEEPVPRGVYLIKDDLGLGGVFVEGEIDRLVLSVEESYQVISFETGEKLWELKFSPALSKTIFRTPDDVESHDLLPRGIVLVNGNIASLSGLGSGSPGIPNKETPSLLQGVNLTIISPDEVTITSSLLYQGITWRDKIPYLKDSDAQLNIFASGKDFFSDTEREGHVVIAKDASDSITLHGAITACGKGMTIKGTGKNVEVFGGIQVSSCDASGSIVEVTPDLRFLDCQLHLRNSPAASCPVLSLSSLRIRGWKDG